MPTTVTDLHTQIHSELDIWDREYEFDTIIGGCRLTVAYDGFDLHIEHISVPDGMRSAGYGTAILTAVCRWADQQGEALRLHMSTEHGTDVDVLDRFYRKHGFARVNKGGDMLRSARHTSPGELYRAEQCDIGDLAVY